MDARLIVVAGIAAAAWMQGPAGAHNEERRRNDFRYTPDPAVVLVAAGAHKSTAADLLWLRTLPDMSKEFADPVLKARWIDNSLESITDLEPSFMTVYDFGQAYLTYLDRRAKGAADRAIALLEKGIRANPDSSGLHVRLAMIHFLEKHDRAKTIEILGRASVMPGFDSLSANMLTTLMAKQRDDAFALRYWVDRMEEGTPEMRRVATLHFWRTKNEIARRAAREFKQATGHAASAASDLNDPKLLQPEAIPAILDGLEFAPDGMPRYPKLFDLEIADFAQSAEAWARTFHDSEGRWPKLDEFESLPAAPAGKAWRFSDGKMTLVEAK
ncbi:MAG: hypothetical protein K8T90_22145 [Planctomycetes bacterium]|nr:hypothetical protein [Planctomycetota bacterium]